MYPWRIYRRVLSRESICACTFTYAYIYSSNLHPQSGSFDLNTVDVRAGESLTRLLVEIFRAQVRRWRGSRKLAGVPIFLYFGSRFNRSPSNRVHSDWTSTIRSARNPSSMRFNVPISISGIVRARCFQWLKMRWERKMILPGENEILYITIYVLKVTVPILKQQASKLYDVVENEKADIQISDCADSISMNWCSISVLH